MDCQLSEGEVEIVDCKTREGEKVSVDCQTWHEVLDNTLK